MPSATNETASKNGAAKEGSLFWVHAGLVAVQLGFASHAVVGKLVVRELPPGALAVVRATSAALVFVLVHLARSGAPRVPRRDLAMLALCSLLGIAANQVLFFEGLARTTAIHASLLVATIPVFTLLTSLALRHEAPTWRSIVGAALALSGVVYLIGIEGLAPSAGTLFGDLLVVGNSLCYGVYLVLVRPLVQKHGSLRVVVWLFVFGTLWIAPYGALDLVRTGPEVPLATWGLVAYIVAVATVFTYLVNAWALGRAPSSTVAIYIYLQPIGAAVLAVLILGESLTSRVAVAAALVFAGIYLVVRKK